jgi:hypothetical protein
MGFSPMAIESIKKSLVFCDEQVALQNSSFIRLVGAANPSYPPEWLDFSLASQITRRLPVLLFDNERDHASAGIRH